MFVELIQKGVRTVYRTLGAREVAIDHGSTHVHGFLFEGPSQRPIAFLHGLGDASTTWHRLVRPLRERTSVLALDLPPFGLSSLDGQPFLPPQEQADIVAGFLDQTFGEPVTLVGQSMGGWIAQWLVHLHPETVDRAILISPAGAPLPGSLEAVDLLTPSTPEDVLTYFENLWYDPPAALDLAARGMYERLNAPEVQEFIDAMTEEHLLALSDLAAIEVPGLVLWGMHDGLLDPKTPAFLAEHWGAPLERSYLARAGHMPHLERPRTVLERMVGFAGLD